MRGLWRYSRPLVVATLLMYACVGPVFAQPAESENYQVVETEFGASTRDETCSEQYCATVSIGGGPSTGDSVSGGSTASFGSITGIDPLLEMIVEQGEENLGELSPTKTGTKTMIIKVRTYLTDGYFLQINGDPPSIDGNTLNALSSPTASDPGTEQFGLNLVENSTPNVGFDPIQKPDTDTSFGEVEDDYKIENLFKYSSGDVIARSERATGQTEYTVSIIVNISNTTPAGHYSGDFSAVVVPLY